MAVAKVERPSFTKPNGNGSSNPAAVLYDAVLPPPTAWQRLFKWEKNLTVAGRVIEKGFVVTPTMAVSLLVALAGMALTVILALGSVAGFMYNRMANQITAKDQAYQEQRDMLVEIKTELKLRKETDEKDRRRLEAQIGDLHAWQQVTNRDLARVIPNRRPPN